MVNNINVYAQKLREDAIMPNYAHGTGDSGMDVYAAAIDVKENGKWNEYDNYMLDSNETVLVKIGYAFAIPEGTELQVRPTSGNSLKTLIRVANAPGTIDASFRGEVGVIITNTGEDPITIHHGDKIAQLVLCPVLHASINTVDTLPESVRGTNGWGSTGTIKDVK